MVKRKRLRPSSPHLRYKNDTANTMATKAISHPIWSGLKWEKPCPSSIEPDDSKKYSKIHLQKSNISLVLRKNITCFQYARYVKFWFIGGLSLPQRGRGTAERWMRRSFADLLYGSTTHFTRAIPFKITILVNFFKDGLSFQGRPPHPPARGVRLSQFSRWRRLSR